MSTNHKQTTQVFWTSSETSQNIPECRASKQARQRECIRDMHVICWIDQWAFSVSPDFYQTKLFTSVYAEVDQIPEITWGWIRYYSISVCTVSKCKLSLFRNYIRTEKKVSTLQSQYFPWIYTLYYTTATFKFLMNKYFKIPIYID